MTDHDGTHDCYGRLWDVSMSLKYGQCPYRAGAQQERERLRALNDANDPPAEQHLYAVRLLADPEAEPSSKPRRLDR